ncbi:conjugal transfer protein TraF [Hymenobacter lutimineralis]|uniref:Conjugal transfer protein TraF n=1 Tax=Hymenobacter lutimineralis TaxID=2606448 RepID=A0A5D6VHP6_9BACT|nr:MULTISPECIES: PorV/PorQ family protein [Hymenobacter]QIX60330.1 conjugal transfer protein TraF [Hymenobacter sp. BT18]TYZ14248.1 conjugal transfer protein TraF [Hymenobacter lutimineralis]
MKHFFRFSRLLGAMGLGLGLTSAALAQSTDNTPKYANEFLNIGVGGRALGMGNTQVSLAQDATAGYWNPAGLLNQKAKYDAVLMHSELFSGIVKNDYAAFAMPLDEKSAIGASIIRLGVDDIADTRALVNEYGQIDYSRISYFSVADYALLLSYARKLGPEGLTLGGSGKIVYRNVGSFATAWGFGFDAGAQYQRGNWRLGLMARDITTTITAWSINSDKFRESTNDTLSIPKSSSEITLPRFVLGAAYNVKLPGQFTALVATDLEMTTDGQRNTAVSTSFVSIDPKLGLEIGYNNVAFLRAGVSNFQKIEGTTSTKESWRAQPSLGVGFTASGLRLDVALSRLAVEQAKTNSIIVSLGYGFH